MATRLERHAEVVASLRIQIGRMGNMPVLDGPSRTRIGFGLERSIVACLTVVYPLALCTR